MSSRVRALVGKDPWLFVVLGWSLAYASIALWLTRRGAALTPDAIDYAEAARSLVRGQGDTIDRVLFHTGLFPKIRHPLEVHGLLHPYLLAPLFWLWGPQGGLARVPSVVFAAALGVVGFAAARRLFGLCAGLLVAACVFSRPDVVYLALLGTDDVGHALFVFSAIACFAIGLEARSRVWFVAAGLAAAGAALEKFSGMVLPGLFALVLAFSRTARARLRARDCAWLVLPMAVVMALYVARNYRVYGTPSSPYGGIEWLGKDDFKNYFGLYQPPPTVQQAMARLGAARVRELVLGELRQLVTTVLFGDVWILLGLATLPWLFRRNFAFALCVFAYTLAIAFVVCVLHHVEKRYLSALIPLYATAFGAAVSSLLAWVGAGLSRVRVVLRFVPAAVLLGGLISFRTPLVTMAVIGAAMQKPYDCLDASAYLRRTVPPSRAVLSSNAWLVSWDAERPAVGAPTNGPSALLAVARHYRTEWALSDPRAPGFFDLEAALRTPELEAALRPELAFSGSSCKVFRLRAPR